MKRKSAYPDVFETADRPKMPGQLAPMNRQNHESLYDHPVTSGKNMFDHLYSIHQHKNQKTVYYQINLELTDLETNEKVWIGDKKIKKAIRN